MIMAGVSKYPYNFTCIGWTFILIPALLSGKVIIFKAVEIIKAKPPDSEPVLSCSFVPEFPDRHLKRPDTNSILEN